VPWLAARENFADAAATLRKEFNVGTQWWPDPLAILQDRFATRLRALRMGCAFGAVSHYRAAVYTTAELRRLKTRPAREALAALGEIDWRSASRRERAAFMVWCLVRAREAAP
jgi:hypothetical protein